MSSPSICSPVFPKLRQYIFPVLLCLLTLATYARLFSCGFIEGYDDEPYITQNPVVAHGLTLEGLRWSFTTFTAGNWNPLTWWSHMIDVTMFGMNPAGHHAVSLIIHIANALLLYLFFFRVTGLRARSFLVAALFSLHPLHVESVAWAAERKDVLSSLFGLCALHAYLSYTSSQRRALYLVMSVLFCCSLMAKPMLVTFPFLLLLLDYWPLERMRHTSFHHLFLEKIPLFIPVAAISVVTMIAQKSAGAMPQLAEDTFFLRISVALNAYVVYLRKFFAPYDLASYYPYASVPADRLIAATAVLALISALVWRLCRQRPWLLTGWLWFAGMLVPVIGIVRVGAQSYADRYTYLPVIGVIVIVVWGGAELLGRVDPGGHARTAISAVAILACAALAWTQTGFWKDGFSLYTRELAVTEGNWHAHLGLGNMLTNRKCYDEGILHYYAILITNPLSPAAHRNLGVAFEKKGDTASAQTHFQAAMQLLPESEDNYLSLAQILRRKGDLEGALRIVIDGLRHVPYSTSLHANKALVLQRMGRIEEAITAFQYTLNLNPGFVEIYVPLGGLLEQSGRVAELRGLLEQLNRINPAEARKLSQTLHQSGSVK